MPNRRARPARVLRGRTSWCVVLVAALLNALTPVFAYAIGQPLHELAGGAPAGVRAVLAQDRAALHHAGMHAGHAGHVARVDHAHDDSRADSPHAVPAPEPAAAHCPYCLDFAAGAPLAPAVAVMPTAQAGHAPLPVAAPPQPAVRPSVRLAAPRGPPATA